MAVELREARRWEAEDGAPVLRVGEIVRLAGVSKPLEVVSAMPIRVLTAMTICRVARGATTRTVPWRN